MEEYIEALQFYSFLERGSVLNYGETWQYLLHSPGLRKHCLANTDASNDCNPTHWNTDGVQRCQVCAREKKKSMGSNETGCQGRLITPASLAKPAPTDDRCSDTACTCCCVDQTSTPAPCLAFVLGISATGCLQPRDNTAPSPHQSWLQLLPHDVFILGLSDVSGELMRYCIKSVAVGELEQKDRVVNCLRQMKAGYVALGPHTSKYMSNKIYVHERNLAKVENVNYDLRLRGSELTPAQLKDDLLRRPLPDEDEGQAALFP